jgi:hypothetical protein
MSTTTSSTSCMSCPLDKRDSKTSVKDKDLALISSILTGSIKDFTKIIESFSSKKSEEKSYEVPPAALEQYHDALKRYMSKDATKHVPCQARVAFFHWDDGMSEKKTKVGGSGEKKTDDESKTNEKKNGQGSTSKKTVLSHRRKRVIAYIWVDMSDNNTRKGLVFYGGSVFNPTLSMRTLLQRCVKGRVHTAEELTAFYQSLKDEFSGHHEYNRKGEKETAFGRLLQRPVVFETLATNHAQVRKEIRRQMFVRGVYGPRQSAGSTKSN